MKHNIDVVVRVQDNQDGGYSVYVYGSEQQMLDDHPMRDEWDDELDDEVQRDLTPEEIREILEGDDEYENGYISSSSMVIEIVDGVAKLAESFDFYVGQ